MLMKFAMKRSGKLETKWVESEQIESISGSDDTKSYGSIIVLKSGRVVYELADPGTLVAYLSTLNTRSEFNRRLL